MTDHRVLDLGEVQIGVDAIVSDEEIQALLASTATWSLYSDAVTAMAVDLAAVPAGLRTRPFASELAQEDNRHDALGTAARLAVEAAVADPATESELRETGKKLLAEVLPTKKELNEPYAAEVRAAAETKQHTSAAEAKLRLFPLPAGRTVFDVMQDFVVSKEAISELLGKRAKAVAAATPGEAGRAGTVRRKALALLRRFRKALLEEMSLKSSLPGNLDVAVFGKLDQLASLAGDR